MNIAQPIKGCPSWGYSEVKASIIHNREESERSRMYTSYPVNRSYASDYLETKPKWYKRVVKYLDSLNQRGENTVHVDICGKANGLSLGAKRSYCFSLTVSQLDQVYLPRQVTLVEGDIFSLRDFSSFINLLRDNGDHPAFVTFEPIVGLEPYTPNEEGDMVHHYVTYMRLRNNLCRMIEILKGGGYIYLSRPFQHGSNIFSFALGLPREEYELSKWLQEICDESNCSLEIEHSLGGLLYLIRKRKIRRNKRS